MIYNCCSLYSYSTWIEGMWFSCFLLMELRQGVCMWYNRSYYYYHGLGQWMHKEGNFISDFHKNCEISVTISHQANQPAPWLFHKNCEISVTISHQANQPAPWLFHKNCEISVTISHQANQPAPWLFHKNCEISVTISHQANQPAPWLFHLLSLTRTKILRWECFFLLQCTLLTEH